MTLRKNEFQCVCGNVMAFTILEDGGWFSVSGVKWEGLLLVCRECGRMHSRCNECGKDVYVFPHDIPVCEKHKKLY